jgi:predicted transcriptional regulator
VAAESDGNKSVVSLEDNSAAVLTDFTRVRPFTITPTATIGETNHKMIACGVRLLFVTQNDQNLIGLVTYNDVFGEKPLQYVQEHGGRHEDVLVQDIFTPLEKLEALDHGDVLKARVGDIVETYKSSSRQHILVVETDKDGLQRVRGMFSSSHIEKMLNTKLQSGARAHTFADLERALVE